ncbi:hypothetical protein STRCI_008190 [Streptomyces cinnabarinus]|uniref:Uncharacterized protein n=1 Tax=Streptomyces cinnabarinus TaxID=67287 RepID=A0ABY7KPW6_9ACTN|nr:ADP-ribosylglycohydrolase family protein [Streptomyces cinnabarinus]WAZ26596.1 hypothetical protein STRCI_008190 [Streptomyces cinnabarinus]
MRTVGGPTLVAERELAEGSIIDQDCLALRLAEANPDDTHRGYGAFMHEVLRGIGAGQPRRQVAPGQFGGQDSSENGAALRLAPLGAWQAAGLDGRVAVPGTVAGAGTVAQTGASAVRTSEHGNHKVVRPTRKRAPGSRQARRAPGPRCMSVGGLFHA